VALTIRPLALPTPASAASLLQSDELQDPHAQGLIAVGKQVASIAHDFNNLLTIICGGLENLRDQFDEHDSRKAVIDLVEAASLRASDVTRGLLDLARFGSTTPNPEFLQCDLTAVTREYAPVLEGMLGPNRVLQLTVPDRPTDVPVDSVRIGQVLLNLTSNSRDAMPDGGTLTIRIERADAAILADGRAGPAAILTVSDTGFGMDSETLDQAFEPFFTTKPLGMGSGIGLSTVADIVRMAGGYIVPESHPGIGTTIQIALPLIETSLGIIPGSEIIET
jgi:signal transduction histidine kinase